MTATEIAAGIKQHFKRMEQDPSINTLIGSSIPHLWNATCYQSGSRVFVVYVSFQGSSSLKKQEALKYLQYLDSGKTGRHWAALKESAPAPNTN